MKISNLAVAGVGVIATGLALAGCGQLDNASAPASSAPASSALAPSSSVAPPPSSAPDSSASQPTAAPSGGSGSSADCKVADLRITLGGGDSGAGSTYRSLVFTNKGSRTCTIQGYPGVSYVAGDNGTQVGESAFRPGGSEPKVTLTPGKSVSAQLQLTQAGNFDPAQCKPTPIRGLRVYPPHDTASAFVPTSGTGCAGSTHGSHQLVIKPVQ